MKINGNGLVLVFNNKKQYQYIEKDSISFVYKLLIDRQ